MLVDKDGDPRPMLVDKDGDPRSMLVDKDGDCDRRKDRCLKVR